MADSLKDLPKGLTDALRNLGAAFHRTDADVLAGSGRAFAD